MNEDRVLSTEEGLDTRERESAGASSPGPAGVEGAFRRARREAWLTRVTAVAVVCVLVLWGIRGQEISPTGTRIASGIILSIVALGVAVLLAVRAGHSRMLAERAYLIELHQSTTRARHQVVRDHLSGLYSRWFFFERLGEELARCARYNRVASVACLYFPGWKETDLTTQAQLIERVGYLLQHDLRNSDIAARWGPGRFVWYLPETDAADALLAARRLAEGVKTAASVVGTAQFPVDGSTSDELLRVAEARADGMQAAA